MGSETGHDALLLQLSETGRFWRVEYEELSEPEQVFRAIWELESQVNNGGFDQYFFNSSGDTAFAVVGALKSVGAQSTASIAARASAVFPDSLPPRDQTERQGILESLTEEQEDLLQDLDDEFLAYPDNLTELLFDYVRRHSTQIQGAAKLGTLMVPTTGRTLTRRQPHAVLKIPGVVIGMTVVTWSSIHYCWGELYATGKVPYYYAGSMALLRPCVHGPLQLGLLGGIAVWFHRRLLRVPVLVLVAACVALWPAVSWLDTLALACFDDGSDEIAEVIWELGPHVASMGLLFLSLCVARPACQTEPAESTGAE